MKWFQHYSDSYTNLKLQELISEFGIEGYGVFWICCELVAQQGINYKIDNGKNWKKALAYIVKLPLAKIDDILTKMGEINLIDKDAYIKNSLFIPKMAEYSDDYSRRVRRVSEHTPNNVRQDKIRLDKNTISDSAKKPNTDVPDSSFKDISYELEDKPIATGKAKEAKELCNWYDKVSQETFGGDPRLSYVEKGYFIVIKLLKKYTHKELKDILTWYLETDKFNKYPQITAALSADTLRLYSKDNDKSDLIYDKPHR